ncbi:MAG TPA: PIN domain-containing protein [Pirellulales bacterium]|nr:PIN domain-containing protein [Pirellulales bacterium]
MTPLLDINVVLDVLLLRQPWYSNSAQVWDAHRDGRISAAIAAFTIPTVFYIMRR